MRLVSLQRRPQSAPSLLLAREDPENVWELRHRICWLLDLGLSSLQSCEKEIFVVYKLPSLWYSVIAARTDYDLG